METRSPRGALDLFRSAERARHVAGWRRALDPFLRKTGPTWQATPIRRAVQTGGLLVYLWLFFVVSWPYPVPFSSRVLPDKEWLPAEAFLWVDPLVGLSTAIAARAWNVALIGMAVIWTTSWVLPRGFCGYLCPLGTLIDLVDFILEKGAGLANKLRNCALSPAPRGGERGDGDCLVKPHRTRREVRPAHGWANVRFYVLAAVLAAAVGGVLFSGFVAAIPLLTRGLLFSFGNLQLGLAKNWGMVLPYSAAVWLSLALFFGVFVLGLLGPRFWCRYLCPSGALLSLFGFVGRFKRQVDDRCIACGKCLSACPFDAVAPDFGSRTLNCAFCQTCGGVCPADAIHFVPRSTPAPAGILDPARLARSSQGAPSVPSSPMPSRSRIPGVARRGRKRKEDDGAVPGAEDMDRPEARLAGKSEVTLGRPLTRRAMLGSVAIGAASAYVVRGTGQARPIRPPGSLTEDRFLDCRATIIFPADDN